MGDDVQQQYQWRQPLNLEGHNSFIVTFNNILLINLATQVPSVASTHVILSFIVPILVTFVQIKFPGIMSSSPFETNHTTVMLAIASLLAYCFTVGVRLRLPSYGPTYSRFAMMFFGLLLVASLLSLLLSESWNHVPNMMFILYFMGHFFGFVQLMLSQLAYQQVVRRLRARELGSRTLLPLTFMDLHHVH